MKKIGLTIIILLLLIVVPVLVTQVAAKETVSNATSAAEAILRTRWPRTVAVRLAGDADRYRLGQTLRTA